MQLLERHKKSNPHNYKIQWHTSTHDHPIEGKFSCDCGFINKAMADPASFGLTKGGIDLVINILQDMQWTDPPEIL